MTALLVEARITLSNAAAVMEILCGELASLCKVRSADANARILCFDLGRAHLCTTDNDLLMRVEANDLVACHAIEMLLEGHLAQIDGVRQPTLLWVKAQKEPFAALASYSTAPQVLPAPRIRGLNVKKTPS